MDFHHRLITPFIYEAPDAMDEVSLGIAVDRQVLVEEDIHRLYDRFTCSIKIGLCKRVEIYFLATLQKTLEVSLE